MTPEEKQLLIKDLCARFPYRVICRLSNKGEDISITEKLGIGGLEHFIFGTMDVKPYLRPMSSMTEEETIKYVTLTHYNTDDNGKPYRELTIEAIDWLNENHFDYRGLIPMGLSLKAPEGMYKNE